MYFMGRLTTLLFSMSLSVSLSVEKRESKKQQINNSSEIDRSAISHLWISQIGETEQSRGKFSVQSSFNFNWKTNSVRSHIQQNRNSSNTPLAHRST